MVPKDTVWWCKRHLWSKKQVLFRSCNIAIFHLYELEAPDPAATHKSWLHVGISPESDWGIGLQRIGGAISEAQNNNELHFFSWRRAQVARQAIVSRNQVQKNEDFCIVLLDLAEFSWEGTRVCITLKPGRHWTSLYERTSMKSEHLRREELLHIL